MPENLPAKSLPANPSPVGGSVPAKSLPAKSTPAKTPAKRKTQAELIAEAVSAALAEERAKSTPVTRESGYRARLAQSTPAAMIGFTLWMAKEFPELKIDVDPKTGRASDRFEKLVTIASKEYRAFQAVRHQFGY